MSWQPIETAPKDGTKVWLFIPSDEPQQVVGLFDTWGDHSWWAYADRVLQDITGEAGTPTHWMPLPAPPEPTP